MSKSICCFGAFSRTLQITFSRILRSSVHVFLPLKLFLPSEIRQAFLPQHASQNTPGHTRPCLSKKNCEPRCNASHCYFSQHNLPGDLSGNSLRFSVHKVEGCLWSEKYRTPNQSLYGGAHIACKLLRSHQWRCLRGSSWNDGEHAMFSGGSYFMRSESSRMTYFCISHNLFWDG